MMTFIKDLVLLLSPFILIRTIMWVKISGIYDFIKWYKERKDEKN